MFYERFVYFDAPPEAPDGIPDSADAEVAAIEQEGQDARGALAEEFEVASPSSALRKQSVLDSFATLHVDNNSFKDWLEEDLHSEDHPFKRHNVRSRILTIFEQNGMADSNAEFLQTQRAAIEAERAGSERDQEAFDAYMTVLEDLQVYQSREAQFEEPLDGLRETMDEAGEFVSRNVDLAMRNIERSGTLGQATLYGGAFLIAAMIMLRSGAGAQRIRGILGSTAMWGALGAAAVFVLPQTVTGRTIPQWFERVVTDDTNNEIADYLGVEYETDDQRAAVDHLMYSLSNDSVAGVKFSRIIDAHASIRGPEALREMPASVLGGSNRFDNPEARGYLYHGVSAVVDKFGPGSELYNNNHEVQTAWETGIASDKPWSEVVLDLFNADPDSERLTRTHTGEAVRGLGGFSMRQYERVRRSNFIDNTVDNAFDEFDDVRDKLYEVTADLPYGSELLALFNEREYPEEYLREHASYRVGRPEQITGLPNVQFADLALEAFQMDESGEGIFEDAIGAEYTLIEVRIERPYDDNIVDAVARAYSEGCERFAGPERAEINQQVLFGAVNRGDGKYYLAMMNRPAGSLASNLNLEMSAFPLDDLEEFGFIDDRVRLELMVKYQITWEQSEQVIRHFATEENDSEAMYNYLFNDTEAVQAQFGENYEFNEAGFAFYESLAEQTQERIDSTGSTNDEYAVLLYLYSAAYFDSTIANGLGVQVGNASQIEAAYLERLGAYIDRSA